MFRSTTIALLIFSLATLQVEADDTNEAVPVDEGAFRELQSAILRSNEIGLDQSALILTLGHADNASARKVLIEIADYYLGSAVSESVVAAISMQGEAILDDIDHALNHETTCVATDQTQCLSGEDRDRFLRRLKEIAASGELVEYVW